MPTASGAAAGEASPTAPRGPESSGAPLPRLTVAGVWRDFVQRFLNLEHGLLHTAAGMMTRPGVVVRRYVDGHRREYVNPFTYLIFSYILAIGVLALVDFEAVMVESLRHQLAEQAAEQGRLVPRQLEEALVQAVTTMFQNSHFISIVICIPFSLFLRLLSRASAVNLAEAFVFALYTFAQSSLVGSVFALRLLWPGQSADTVAHTYVSYAIMALISAWVAVGFFGRSVKAVLKTWLALAGAYVVFFVLFLALVIGYTVYLVAVVGVGSRQATLFLAAEQGEVGLAESLLREGAEIDRPLATRALHLAAERGHLPVVELLVAEGAALDPRDHLGRTPLELAIDERHAEVAAFLIAKGADAEAARDDGRTVLMTAVARRLDGVVRQLLLAGADPDATRDHERATALMLAAARGDREIVGLLLAQGADPSVTNREGATAADLARTEELRRRLEPDGPGL